MSYENEKNLLGYYAIVRYCPDLKFVERLMYGEITALLNNECFYVLTLQNIIHGAS